MPAHAGAESLNIPHQLVTLQFSEVVNDHANYYGKRFFRVLHIWAKTSIYIISFNTDSGENKVPENSKLDVMILNHPTVILGIGPCAPLNHQNFCVKCFMLGSNFAATR